MLGPYKKNVTMNYIYRGLLPMIYKYVKGIISLFYYETPDELKGCKLRIDLIYETFDAKKEEIYKLCERPSRTKVADALLSTFNNVDIANNLNVNIEGRAIDSHDQLEQEEILYQSLFDLRRKGSQLISLLSDLYQGSKYEYILEMYLRETNLKSKIKMFDSQISKTIQSSTTFEKVFDNFIEESNKEFSEGGTGSYYQAFVLLKQRYIAIKRKYEQTPKQNKFIIVMEQELGNSADETSESFKSIVDYFKRIYSEMYITLDWDKEVSRDDYHIKSFWLNPIYFTYTIF